jgi:hypothetical protein
VRYLAALATLALLVFLSPLLCGGPRDHDLGADRASARRDPELRARPDAPATLPVALAPKDARR